jgi:hypothetical protein
VSVETVVQAGREWFASHAPLLIGRFVSKRDVTNYSANNNAGTYH